MLSRSCIVIALSFLFMGLEGQDITGLWQGTIYNDTTGKHYRYEIAISEQKGKLSGFTHTWFEMDNVQYYGVKKVKIHKAQDGKIIVEDDGLVTNNYPVKPAKNVRQLNILQLEENDSLKILSGPFTTNRTREYSALTGHVKVQRKNDYRMSALVPHLEELALLENLSFVKDQPVAVVDAGKSKDIPVRNAKILSNKKRDQELNKPTTPPIVVKVYPPAFEVSKRENIVQQTVYFSSDSLQLSLYDNGEVDGDTVSVLMNDVVILAKERLSTTAVRKTIYTGHSDSIKLVMYAENLGTIAPNTGLLIVRDGKEQYEIRFSGNLGQNAAIIFRKKRR